jgi:DMSO reductase anchor subunit
MLPAVPAWNSPLTPVSFVITAVTGGLSVLLLLNAGYGTGLQRILMVILSFTILLFTGLLSLYVRLCKGNRHPDNFFNRLATGLVALITIYLIYFKIIPNKILP